VGLGFQLPDVLGDPQALRGLASQLRGLSTQLGSLQDELSAVVRGMTFEGPAADAFRARSDGYRASLQGDADQLGGFATLVDQAADQIEAEQRALLRALEAKATNAVSGNG
jgi:uncharacterized protein YukE